LKTLGRHLIVDFYDCEPRVLENLELIQKEMLTAAELTGATVVGAVFHPFEPGGVSGAVVIAESHLSIHTWPGLEYAALDFFTCGSHTDPWKGFAHLKRVLRAGREKVTELNRGVPEVRS
jgi:S-adenosylmethionine decarboxylase